MYQPAVRTGPPTFADKRLFDVRLQKSNWASPPGSQVDGLDTSVPPPPVDPPIPPTTFLATWTATQQGYEREVPVPSHGGYLSVARLRATPIGVRVTTVELSLCRCNGQRRMSPGARSPMWRSPK